ncbi:MAG TPA: sorbosone dehydrogenase family protein [Pseudacidobacterium sp.]|jgi:glucose/arabinose dehydrogenase|nr:sorbosone dehydrogenase family protein [Pseudacidobacterium sp.]
MRKHFPHVAVFTAIAALSLVVPVSHADGPPSGKVLTGKDAFTDYSKEKPGVRRKLTVADLPEPFATTDVDNGAEGVKIPRPDGAWPQAPAGFKVELYATGFNQPRLIRTAPNGDLFVALSYENKVMVFRGVGPDGKAKQMETFADDLNLPFGIAFYPAGPNPKWVYIGNTDGVIRFPYQNGDLKARGPAEHLTELPGGGKLRGGGHWTRDIVFSKDGTKMFVSVGSHSNVDDPDTHPEEFHRADVLEFTPEGKFIEVYASGIRNCVGEAIHPVTGELWCSTNERDRLGDNLVPDYITHVQEGGFYGWPWYYMGPHQDPRHDGKHPELKAKVITPDVLLQPHFASLEMNFYEASQFPKAYKGDAFAAEHGSWNKSQRAGYEVILVPMKNGHATGEYEDFLTGFTTADGHVWGRPVGVTVGNDGSLYVTDDGSGSIWRVSYTGK